MLHHKLQVAGSCIGHCLVTLAVSVPKLVGLRATQFMYDEVCEARLFIKDEWIVYTTSDLLSSSAWRAGQAVLN